MCWVTLFYYITLPSIINYRPRTTFVVSCYSIYQTVQIYILSLLYNFNFFYIYGRSQFPNFWTVELITLTSMYHQCINSLGGFTLQLTTSVCSCWQITYLEMGVNWSTLVDLQAFNCINFSFFGGLLFSIYIYNLLFVVQCQ